jgi:hypothetical protein
LTAEDSTLSTALGRRSRMAIISYAVIALSLITIMTILITTVTNNSGFDNIALAQTQGINNTAANSSTAVSNTDTLRAKGQISSLASDVLAGRPSANSSEMGYLVEIGNLV